MQRRRLRLLLPDGPSIHTAAGALPAIDVELRERETTTAAAWRTLPEIGLSGPVLDCFVDQSGQPAEPGVDIHAALVEPARVPSGWHAPAGWTRTPLAATAPHVEVGLAPVLAGRLAELRGERPVDRRRVPWALPGWYERASAWIEGVLHETGRPAPTAIIQSRHWGISAVMEVDTPAGRLWFKAAGGPFRREAAITAIVDRAVPRRATDVIAIDDAEAWMLLEHIDGTVIGEDRGPTQAAFDCLVDIQAEMAGHVAELLAAGCPNRPIGALPHELRATLATPLMRAMLDLSPERVEQLIATLTEAVTAVERVGLADTFVHGDFHPGNAMMTADGVRLFDWSDVAVSNPVVDVVTWASWFRDDPDHVDAVYRAFHDARSAKLGRAPGRDLDGVERRLLDAVAGAYHTMSYAGILEEMEPHRRAEHAEGIDEFFSLLDAATPRSGG